MDMEGNYRQILQISLLLIVATLQLDVGIEILQHSYKLPDFLPISLKSDLLKFRRQAGLAEQRRDGLQIHFTWVQIPRPAPLFSGLS